MKSAFAFIAVAMMIMVAVVPMAGVLVSDNSVSADDVDYVTVVVKQNGGATLDDVTILTDGVTIYKTSSGQVKIPLTAVVNKVLTPTKTGFAFYPASITMNSSTVKAGDTYTFTAFTNQTVVTITAGGLPVSGVIINAITKTAYDPTSSTTPSWNGQSYTTDANGKVYISMTEAEMYIKVTNSVMNPNGMAGTATYAGEDGLKDSAYKINADKSITAGETLYTIEVKDKAGQAITTARINVGMKDDRGVSTVTATTSETDGKAQILFKKSEEATKVIATATNATGYTFSATAGVAEKDVGGTTATFNSLETTYTLKVTDKDKRLSLNGSMTVTYTNASQTNVSTIATFANDVWSFTVLEDGQVSNITVTLTNGSFKDALDNAFTFPGNESEPTADKYVITNPGKSLEIVSTDGTIQISGSIFYKDGSTKFDKAATITFGTASLDNTVVKGAYVFYVKSVPDAEKQITITSGNYTSANTAITLKNVTKDLSNMDFILNQSKQVDVSVKVNNGHNLTNMSGLTVKAGSVTLTWNATSSAYVGKLDRASYVITVGPVVSSASASAVTPTVSSGSVTYDLSATTAYAYNEDTLTVTLAPVTISGYISYEVDDAAAKCRPVQDVDASGVLTYSVNGGSATSISTKSNGDYGFNNATTVKSYYGEKVLFEYKPSSGTMYYQKTIDTTSQTGEQVTNVIMDGYEYQSVVTGEIYGWKAFVSNTKMYYVSKVSVKIGNETKELDVDSAGKFNFNTFSDLSQKVQQGGTVTIGISGITAHTDYGLTSLFTIDGVQVKSQKVTIDTGEYIYEGKLVAANGDAPVKGEVVKYYDITDGTAESMETYTTTTTKDDGKFYFFVTSTNVVADALYLVKSTSTSSGYEYSSYFRVQTTMADTPAASTITSGYLTNTILPASYVPRWDGTLHSIDYCISGTAKDAFGENVVANTLQYNAGSAMDLEITDGKFYIGRIASAVTSLTFTEKTAGTYGKVSGGDNWKTQATLALTTEKGVLTIKVTEAKNSYSATALTTGKLNTIMPAAVSIDGTDSTGTYYAKMNSKVEVTLSDQYMSEVLTATVTSATMNLKSSYVTFTFKVPYVDAPSTYYSGKVKIDGTETASEITGQSVTMILKADAKHTVSYDWNGNGYTILNSKDNLSNEDAKLITIQSINMSRHVFKVTYTDASGKYAISGADMNVHVKNDITKANYVNTFVTDDNGQFYLDADVYTKIKFGMDCGIFLFTPFGDLYSLEYKKYVDLGTSFPENDGTNYAIVALAKEVRAVYDFTGYYDHKAVQGLDVTFEYNVAGAATTKIVINATTDKDGRVNIDAVPVNSEITVTSAGYVFIAAVDREIATKMADSITASSYAVELLTGEYAIVGAVNYMSSKGDLSPATDDWVFVNGTDEEDKIVTGENGGFALTELATSYNFVKPGFAKVTVSNIDDANIVNVGGVITFDLGTIVLEYKEMKGAVKVKNYTSFVGADKDLATINDSKITVTSATDMGDVTFSFTTDAKGNYVVEVPGAVTNMKAENDLGYTFSDVTYGAEKDFQANEDRVLVGVVDPDTIEEIKDVTIFGAKTDSKFFIYKAVTDENGVAQFDAVSISSFYVYIPGYNVEYAYGSDGAAITAGTNGTYKLAGYAIQFGLVSIADLVTYDIYVNGEEIAPVAKGDAVVISVENGENGAVLKVITTTDGTYATIINSTTFKYWEMSDGTTNSNAQIAFVAGYDGNVKTVGDSNAYAFTAVFEQSQGDIIPAYPEEKEQKIDPTVLVLGIAAVIVALIAVVYAVIQKKE